MSERRRWRQRPRRGEPVPDFVKEALLENPSRRAIVELLRQRPGLNKNQVCRALDLHTNVLAFHLEKLEQVGLVATRPSALEREVLCFAAEDVHLWENEATRILFGRRPVRDIALYLAEHPGATTRELAKAFDLSPVTVRYHLRTLASFDLVRGHHVGRRVLYEPREELDAWAGEVGEAFGRPWDP